MFRKLTSLCAATLLATIVLAGRPTQAAARWADDTALPVRDQQRLSIFRLTLLGDVSGVDAATRTAAAAELLGMASTQATDVLLDGMHSDRTEVMRAVFLAMADATSANPTLVDAALQVLPTAEADTAETLARLLARVASTDRRLIEQLHAMAGNHDLPDAHRVAAIRALGEFRHTPVDAAAALMAVLEQPLAQPPVILEASTEALSRLTGLPGNASVDVWTAWWSTNRDRPAERWLADMVQALSKRVTELEHRTTDASQRSHDLGQRMLAVHRDLWPLLAVDAQVLRLSDLLQDDLEALRGFGLERAAVLLRDGNAAKATHIAVLARLNDESAAIRLAVSALLAELPPTLVEEALAARLATEADGDVANALLTFCGTHPALGVPTSAMSRHLAVSLTCESAAEALWQRTAAGTTPETMAELRDALATATLANPEANLQHLSASLGDAAAIKAITPLLETGDDDTRARTAEALRRGGHTEAVLARVDDHAVFPVVITILQQPGGRTAFDALSQLQAPDAHRPLWLAAVQSAAQTTAVADRVDIDRVFDGIEGIEPKDRIDLLIAAVAPEQPASQRLAAAERLVPLLQATGADLAIMSLIEGLPLDQRPEGLQDAAFLAALRARQFEAAATLQNAARPWVVAYEAMLAGRPELADLVRTEIVRRFNDALDAPMRSRLGMAKDPLMGDASDKPGA